MAQDVPTETPTDVPTVDVTATVPVIEATPDPNACVVNFINMARQGVNARYYVYLSGWQFFSTVGATGSVTMSTEVFGATVLRGKLDTTTGDFVITARNHVDPGLDFTFTADNTNAPQIAVVFDCTTNAPVPVDTTAINLFSIIDRSCVVLNRPQVNGINLPGIYAFLGLSPADYVATSVPNIYVEPVFNTAGTLKMTSTLQTFSTASSISVYASVGHWTEDLTSGVARSVTEEANYQSQGVVTTYTMTAPINAGDASLTSVSCG